MKEKNKTKNDIIFIAAILLIAAVGLFYLYVLRESGDTVKVTVDGELYAVYSLAESITEDIRSGTDGINRLVIKDGKAYMESATCPDGICVSHPPVYRNGESIVCLPNRVVVTVITEGESDTPDVIA